MRKKVLFPELENIFALSYGDKVEFDLSTDKKGRRKAVNVRRARK